MGTLEVSQMGGKWYPRIGRALVPEQGREIFPKTCLDVGHKRVGAGFGRLHRWVLGFIPSTYSAVSLLAWKIFYLTHNLERFLELI